ncbi:MAG: helix-turn-helix transcriptional regulator [Pseudonocardia sp.]
MCTLDQPASGRDIVGRDTELDVVDVELRRAERAVSALVVAAEPGMGKTRYLAEVCRRAEDLGWGVATGRAVPQRRESSLSTIVDALAPLVVTDPAVIEDLPAQLAESVTDVLGGVGAGSRSPRMCQLAIGALLDRCAAARPLLLVLDDLHWADVDTVALIEHLIHARTPARVVLALSYRPHQVSGRLAAVLAAACSAGVARCVELGPLSVEQSARLLDADTPGSVARRLHDAAEGNPRYLLALARAGAGACSADRPLPAELSAALAAEVEDLPAPVRLVAHAASVLGSEFDLEPLPVVAELSCPQVAAAVDALVRADLLRADAEPGRLRFRHPLVHQGVYASAGAGWRRGAHARAAHLLTTRRAPVSSLAPHVVHVAEIGDDLAIRVLVRAAAAERWRAPVISARWYGAALRLLPQDWRYPARRGRLLLAEAQCLMTAGLLVESHHAVSAAIPLLRRRSRRTLRRAVRTAAAVHQLRGRCDEAAALLRGAVGDPGLVDADLVLHLATVELLRGELAEAAALARTVAGSSDGGTGGFGACAVLGFVHASTGDTAAARRTADVAVELLDGCSDLALARQLQPVLWLIWTNVMLTRHSRALRDQDRALELCRSGAEMHLHAGLRIAKAETLRRMGRLAQARENVEQAEDLARRSGSAGLALFAAITSTRVAISAGQTTEAALGGADIVERARDASGLFGALAGAVAAEARLLAGMAEDCIAGVLDAGGGERLPHFDPTSQAMLYELLTRAALEADRPDDARRWADHAVEVARRGVLPCSAGYPALAQAEVLLALERFDEATSLALRAAEDFDRADNPLDVARARLVTARGLAAGGQRAHALAEAISAEEIAQGCGAEQLRAEATRELRRLGRRVPGAGTRGRSGSGISALSHRELQVAELAAEGRTNRAIAANLFLSEKTIERHLGSAFAKLGVSSRAALAAQVVTRAIGA